MNAGRPWDPSEWEIELKPRQPGSPKQADRVSCSKAALQLLLAFSGPIDDKLLPTNVPIEHISLFSDIKACLI